MLFEEKKNADNFIHFNKDTILEESAKAPVRSYYCVFCSGWHVTSNPSLEHGEEQDKRDMELIENVISIKHDISSFNTAINQKIIEIKRAIYLSIDDFDVFKEYEYCRLLPPELVRINSCKTKIKLLQQIYMISDILTIFSKIKLMDISELKEYLLTLNTNSEKFILLKRYTMRRIIDLSLSDAISLYESGQLNKADRIKEELLYMLTEVEGTSKKKFVKKCKSIINEVFNNFSFNLSNEENYSSSEQYKDNLIALINNLDTINDEFENLNFSVCNELVKKGISDLSTMPNDSNVNLVLQHYVKWKNTLSRI